jgi:hypothetical protein
MSCQFVFTSNYLITGPNNVNFSCRYRLVTVWRLSHGSNSLLWLRLWLTTNIQLLVGQTVAGLRQHSHSWFQSLLDPWPWFLFPARHVRVSKWGLLFDFYVGATCTELSVRVYPRCHRVQVTTDSAHHLSLHHAKWIYTRCTVVSSHCRCV